jgi:hypothetical protein
VASRYGFLTQQEREDAKKTAADAETVLREKRRQISDATVQRIGPIIRESLAEYFRSMGLRKADSTGEEQAALFNEQDDIKGHSWKAWSWKKTGTHSDYRADGVHMLDEQTAYSIVVSLVINKDGLPLLYIGDYVRSKLVDGKPVAASEFSLEIPSQLAQALENKTGIKLVDRVKFLDAQDN